MNNIETTIRNRRINIAAPDDLPDGTKVIVGVSRLSDARFGIDESEWCDDAQALADWDAWLRTIEPISWREADAFDQDFRRYNVEAVRRQMDEGGAQ